MAKGHDALLKGIAKAHNALRRVFINEDTVVTLLRASSTARQYESLLEVEKDWFFEYSTFRQQFRFEIARDDAEITNAITNATHLAVGPNVYRIAGGDTLPPNGTDVTWKLFCERFETGNQFSILR